MIVLIHTATPVYELTCINGDYRQTFTWYAGRELAKGILRFTEESLTSLGKTWHDIESIGVFRGPGSFTGLRIGVSVWNTVADTYAVPIVGESGDHWQAAALARIAAGENDRLVMPEYGSDAHITTPRK